MHMEGAVMSGGGITDHCYAGGLYLIKDWANNVKMENPVLADMMEDMYDVLHSYDYYLAGDYGEEKVEKVWKKFSDKWLSQDLEKLKPIVMERCVEIIDSVIKGHI